MLGATDTISEPDVAPTGIVNTIPVMLHRSTVIGVPFSSKRLPPCVAPKLLPAISTWLPTEAVVADKPVIVGAGVAVELIDTLSNVAGSRVPIPLTAIPMYTVCAIGTVTLAPICVQFTPSGEVYPVKLFPARTSSSHSGNAEIYGRYGPWTWLTAAPVVGRSCSDT